MDKGENYLDDMKEKYNDMTDSIVKKYEKTFQQAEEAVSSIKS
jgi:hypothetical protein